MDPCRPIPSFWTGAVMDKRPMPEGGLWSGGGLTSGLARI